MHWKDAIMIAYISMATGFFTAYGTYHGHLWKWRDAKLRSQLVRFDTSA